MPDGVRLYTCGTVPPSGEKRPIIVMRNPYCPDGPGDMAAFVSEGATAPEAARRGYAFVLQHCRGTGGSEGVFEPYTNERADGLAFLDWLRRLPFYNGEIYVAGGSYLASVHYAYLNTNPADVKGAYLMVQDCDRYNVLFRNGFFKIGLHGNWFLSHYYKKDATLPRDASVLLSDIPLLDFARRYWGRDVPLFSEPFRHPDRDDPWWRTTEANGCFREALSRSTMPVLLSTGFYDLYTDGVNEMWRSLPPERRANSTLVIDAAGHGGDSPLTGPDAPASANFQGGARRNGVPSMYDWFDAIRTGRPCAGVKLGTAKYFALWENRWITAAALVDGPRTVALPLGKGEVSWIYDPRRELPNFPGSGGLCFGDMQAQPEPDFRDDVRSVLLPPLTERLDVRGRPKARLRVKSDCEDTAFYIRLSVDKGDGVWWLLRDDIVAISTFAPDYKPGTWIDVHYRFADHAFRLEKGDRLRVDLASACQLFTPHTNVRGLQSAIRNPLIAENAVRLEESELLFHVLEN
ncbi:MAG: CocE/NonD family hydrolase [Kiritimatiellia bacterium]